MDEKEIPDIVVGRLPLYLRALQRMAQEGRQVTSSQELGERLGISAAQIRKDLSQFGEFGKQGTGYSIPFLVDQLEAILKIRQVWDIVLVGAGGVARSLSTVSDSLASLAIGSACAFSSLSRRSVVLLNWLTPTLEV